MRNTNVSAYVGGKYGLFRHATDHKFVNTTPKPRATKNSKGELVGPPLGRTACVDVAADGPDAVEDGANVLEEEDGPGEYDQLGLLIESVIVSHPMLLLLRLLLTRN